MASTKYTYSISGDTASAKANSSALAYEIQASALTVSLDYINMNGDVLDVWMKDVMPDDSAGSSASLAALVAAHLGEPLKEDAYKHVKIVEENPKGTPTGGSWKAKGFTYVVPNSVGTHQRADITWNYPISIFSAEWNNQSALEGDVVEIQVAPHTVVGAITSDVTTNDTVINVDATSIANIEKGHFVDLHDGTNTSDMFEVIDKTSTTLTLATGIDQGFTAATPTYVRLTVKIVESVALDGSGRNELGKDAIGGSYVPAGKALRLYYTNNDGAAKTFRFIVEYKY